MRNLSNRRQLARTREGEMGGRTGMSRTCPPPGTGAISLVPLFGVGMICPFGRVR